MLERIDAGPPAQWRYAQRWAARMRGWASRCACLVVAPSGVERAIRAAGRAARSRRRASQRGRHRSVRPAGNRSARLLARCAGRAARRVGCRASRAGSARYDARDVDRLVDGVALLYMGRFTAVKRLDRLIGGLRHRPRSISRSRQRLILVGGHPGEWEGAHPAETIASLGVAECVSRGLAGPGAAARVPRGRRRHRAHLGTRAVRTGPDRGDGVRGSPCRHTILGAVGDHRGRADRLARRSPTIEPSWSRRWSGGQRPDRARTSRTGGPSGSP